MEVQEVTTAFIEKPLLLLFVLINCVFVLVSNQFICFFDFAHCINVIIAHLRRNEWILLIFTSTNLIYLIKMLLCFFSLGFFSQAEQAQTDACEKFEAMSARGKQELTSFRSRRVTAFKKSLIELAELEVKHAKSQYEYLRQSVLALRETA